MLGPQHPQGQRQIPHTNYRTYCTVFDGHGVFSLRFHPKPLGHAVHHQALLLQMELHQGWMLTLVWVVGTRLLLLDL